MNKANKNNLIRIVATRLTMKYSECFEDIARHQNVTVGALIRQILIEWIDRKNDKCQKVITGISDIRNLTI